MAKNANRIRFKPAVVIIFIYFIILLLKFKKTRHINIAKN